jgi:hypothetical protein
VKLFWYYISSYNAISLCFCCLKTFSESLVCAGNSRSITNIAVSTFMWQGVSRHELDRRYPHMSGHLSVCLLVDCRFSYLLVSQSVYLPDFLSLSLCLPDFLFIYLPACLCFSVYFAFCLPDCPSVYHCVATH